MADAGVNGEVCCSVPPFSFVTYRFESPRSNRGRPTNVLSISRQTHERHGPVISIDRTEEVGELTPFRAVQQAYKAQRAWQEEGVKKVRLVVDGQVMSCKQAEKWAHEEYQTLPKVSYVRQSSWRRS